ncbi:MAG TPA: MFS transporter, partial [Hyphomicrobiaceae bacterium]|nr:MFS transporter [Hyphomicrobiaceae bacterium]
STSATRRTTSSRRAPKPAAAAAGGAGKGLKPMPMSPGIMIGLLMVAGVSCCVAMSMPQAHIVAYCGDLKYGAQHGADMLAVLLGFGVISRLVSGWVLDKVGGFPTLIVGSALQAIALALYIPFDSLPALYLISAFFGIVQGGIVPSYAIVIREHFPPSEAGAKFGLVLGSTIAGMALGGWVSGAIFDYTGSYKAAFVHGVAWNILNFAIVAWLMLRARARRSDGALVAA